MSSSNVQIPEVSHKFSNIQLELLRLFSHNLSDEELYKVKDLLGKFFLQKLSDEANESIDRKNIQPDELEKSLNEKS